jgi:hypothetical protein
MRMKQIQVHYFEPDGTTGVVNYLSQDNFEIDRERLTAKATRIAAEWTKVFPNTAFRAVEV